ncbi:hypothetical protein [Shewanella waksmanii]|uniref:hypothetical protein n=1 Tax=Shewanella waksmanii TaxID=213783 RepID=UPI0004B9B793|nr:hypothetical protein [Shewanella waksmanii]
MNLSSANYLSMNKKILNQGVYMGIIRLLVLVTLTLPVSFSTTANNAQDEEQLLLSSCMSLKNSTADISASPCAYYIQGFLAGSLNTSHHYEVRKSSGGFQDRAYRTRVGNQTSKKQPADVCISTNKDQQQLVENVVNRTLEQMPASTDSLQLLHNQIYQALAAESSCEQDD